MFGYTEQIMWAVLRSSFTIDTFTYLVVSILAIILRTHIDMIMAWCMGTDNIYVNMVIHIIVSSTV